MTFVSSFKVQAGLPIRYRFLLIIITLAVPLIFAYLAWQARLGWLWAGLAFVLAMLTLKRFSYFQQQQRAYQLHWDQYAGAYFLLLSGTDNSSADPQRFSLKQTKFTRQTAKLIFSRLRRLDGSQDFLIFHAACNDKNAFRRFKVQLNWEPNRD